MAVCGIIAEFNPLHRGHNELLRAALSGADAVFCVISGNFVQRGDIAVIPKAKRAEAALRCGADIVAELPVIWSMSTAQNFALGGVSQLMALGCDEIMFGSECGDINELLRAAELLERNELSDELGVQLKKGISFAAARETAARRLGLSSGVLSRPNDTLGIEYILAARRLGFSGSFRCFKRIGAGHNSQEPNPLAVSSSMIRERLKKGDIGFAERFMPPLLRGFIKPELIADISRLDTAILAVLRTLPQQAFGVLPDISEGLENRIYLSLRTATSFDELCQKIKSKRYSLARIRRLVLSAFLGLDNRFFGERPPYVRILGASGRGTAAVSPSDVPIVTRAAEIPRLGEAAAAVFSAECRATDLYALAFQTPLGCGAEYKTKFLKTECLE